MCIYRVNPFCTPTKRAHRVGKCAELVLISIKVAVIVIL